MITENKLTVVIVSNSSVEVISSCLSLVFGQVPINVIDSESKNNVLQIDKDVCAEVNVGVLQVGIRISISSIKKCVVVSSVILCTLLYYKDLVFYSLCFGQS